MKLGKLSIKWEMNMNMRIFLNTLTTFMLVAVQNIAKGDVLPKIGEIPPPFVLSGASGGISGGGAFDTSTIKGQVFVMFYVDPDERELNENTEKTLKNAVQIKDRYKSIGAINMKATVIPDFILSSLLASKKEEYPDTIYLEDFDSTFVKKWGLKDDAVQVLVFDKLGKVIFNKDGALSKTDLETLVKTISNAL